MGKFEELRKALDRYLKDEFKGPLFEKIDKVQSIFRNYPEILELIARRCRADNGAIVHNKGLDDFFYIKGGIVEKLGSLARAMDESNYDRDGLVDLVKKTNIFSNMLCGFDSEVAEHVIEHLTSDDGCENLEQKTRLLTTKIGNILIQRRIGGGEFSDVYLGKKIMSGGIEQKVAVKVFKLKEDMKESKQRLFEQVNPADEARTLFEILEKSPIAGIPEVYDFIECRINGQETKALVMRYIEGESFKARYSEWDFTKLWINEAIGRKISCQSKKYLSSFVSDFLEVCKSLSGLHSFGIKHKDPHWENILKSEEGKVYVVDLGLTTSMTADVQGKRSFLSPQVLADTDAYDQQDDIYSIGVLMYRTLTGVFPFLDGEPRGTEDYAVMNHRKQSEKAKPLRKLNPLVPKGLEKIVLKCLERDKARRYQTAEELQKDLEREYEIINTSTFKKLSRRIKLPLVGGLAALILAGSIYLAIKNGPTETYIMGPDELNTVKAMPTRYLKQEITPGGWFPGGRMQDISSNPTNIFFSPEGDLEVFTQEKEQFGSKIVNFLIVNKKNGKKKSFGFPQLPNTNYNFIFAPKNWRKNQYRYYLGLEGKLNSGLEFILYLRPVEEIFHALKNEYDTSRYNDEIPDLAVDRIWMNRAAPIEFTSEPSCLPASYPKRPVAVLTGSEKDFKLFEFQTMMPPLRMKEGAGFGETGFWYSKGGVYSFNETWEYDQENVERAGYFEIGSHIRFRFKKPGDYIIRANIRSRARGYRDTFEWAVRVLDELKPDLYIKEFSITAGQGNHIFPPEGGIREGEIICFRSSIENKGTYIPPLSGLTGHFYTVYVDDKPVWNPRDGLAPEAMNGVNEEIGRKGSRISCGQTDPWYVFKKPGNYSISIVVDPDNLVDEFDETNNKKTIKITVGER